MMNDPDGPIRLLRIIARLNVGGPAKHVTWLMRGLDPARFEQRLLTGRVQAGEDDMSAWVRSQGVAFRQIPNLGRSLHPVRDLTALNAVLRRMAEFRPHIVATEASKAGFLGRLAVLLYRPWARLRGWPIPRVVHTFHGHTFHSYFGPLVGRLFLGLERFMAKRATDRIMVISPRQLSEIRDTFKVGRPEQFILMPLGIDLELFDQADKGRERFRAELAAQPDEMLIGAVGRVAPVKNYGLMVQAAAELKHSRPDLWQRTRMVLIGGGAPHELDQLRAQALEAGVADRLVFLGNRPDPENFFPGLDLLLLTSLNEGTPLSILEGGAVGLPVVATEVGGVPDLLGCETQPALQGVTLRERGITAASGDGPALAEALAWLMGQPSQAQALGLALKEYVHTHHARSRLMRDLDGFYTDLATQR
jgi:glycosyltransferase involved in cell wall biosynthesis